jgi:hypothetical protein
LPRRRSRDETGDFIYILLVIGLVIYGPGLISDLPIPPVTPPPPASAAYTMWVQGSTYYARREATGAVTSSTNLDSFLTGIINTVSAEGGGVIHLNAGTYSSPYGGGCLIYLRTGVTLEGSGRTSTVMNNIDYAIPASNIAITDMGFTGPSHSTYMINIYNSVSNIRLERLTATGIRESWAVFTVNPHDGNLISDVKFTDLTVTDSDGYPYAITGTSMNGGTAENIEWTRCRSTDAGLKPTRKCDWIVGFDITEYARIRNVQVTDCTAERSWESGFHVEYEPTKENVVIRNCESNYNGQKGITGNPGPWMWGYGFLVSEGVTLINPQGTGNYGGLIFNNGDGATIIGD